VIADSQTKGIAYDPFSNNDEVLESIVSLGVQSVGEKHREFLKTFARTFGVDYCPVYSILGSVISQ
jgi:ubiquitin-like 1-activating enzyme E1 A